VEVECDDPAQVENAVRAGADLVLVDNMTPEEAAECVSLAGGRCPIEISGGVTLGNIADFAASGAQFVAIGAITHSAPVLDIALDIQPSI
jgi:nicotinate-nucleotide pyrophosphorylase (carboxylating)